MEEFLDRFPHPSNSVSDSDPGSREFRKSFLSIFFLFVVFLLLFFVLFCFVFFSLRGFHNSCISIFILFIVR